MILTDKALRFFENWLTKQPYARKNSYTKNIVIDRKVYTDLNEIFVNALIVEWFDSDDRINFQDLYMTEFKNGFLMYPISSIQKEAIIKANEIYNNLNK